MRRLTLQTNLFLDTPGPVLKPAPAPLERDFMREVQRYAASLGLPSVHIENYCGNAFNVVCPCCGHSTLAHCRKTLNRDLAGYPDLIGVSWGIETKRAGFEPSPLQLQVHDRLRKQGVPVIVSTPENTSELNRFLTELSKKHAKSTR